MIIRVPRLPVGRTPLAVPAPPPPLPPIRWVEEKTDKCVPVVNLAAAAVTGSDSVDLLLNGGKRLRARFGSDCPALDFYSGFYVKMPKDGKVCARPRFVPRAIGRRVPDQVVPRAGSRPSNLTFTRAKSASARRVFQATCSGEPPIIPESCMNFADLGLSDELLRAVETSGYTEPTAIQAAAIPSRADDARPDRHRPDGHRQDRQLRAADDRHPGPWPQPRADAALADPRADARTRRAGRREFREIRQEPQAQHGAADRRRADGRPGQGAGKGRRRADRHARAG